MATKRSCTACRDLQNNSADFVMNGVTEAVETSIKNNTGFNPSSGHDDCTDLNNANDCLVGNMEDEVSSYDACHWQDFMTTFIHNLWVSSKAVIASICGLWKRVDVQECEISHLFDGDNLYVGEHSSDGSYIKAGGGVSYKFDSDGGSTRVSDVSVLYIAGGLLRVQGTFRFFKDNFTDADGTARSGNSHWNETGPCVAGGELICEAYIKKSQYGVKNIYAGFGQETGGGGYHVNATVFSSGYAYGQHGRCNTATGASIDGGSTGHPVPDGYIIIQLRMSYIWSLNANGASNPRNAPHYSPRAFMGIRFDRNALDCDSYVPPVPPTPTPTKYTITATSGGNGTVSGGGTYDPNDTVTLIATPDAGYESTGWSKWIQGDDVSGWMPVTNEATYTFTATEDAKYEASFSAEGSTAHETITTLSFSAGESGTKTYTFEHTPIVGEAIIVGSSNPASGALLIAGTARTWSLDAYGTTGSYDGDDTITLTATGSQPNTVDLTSVVYKY